MSVLSYSDVHRVSIGFRRRLAFLGDEDLEAGSTLRRGIHRLVSEDDGRARRNDFFRFRQELGRRPTFFRRRDEPLPQFLVPRSPPFPPPPSSPPFPPLHPAGSS